MTLTLDLVSAQARLALLGLELELLRYQAKAAPRPGLMDTPTYDRRCAALAERAGRAHRVGLELAAKGDVSAEVFAEYKAAVLDLETERDQIQRRHHGYLEAERIRKLPRWFQRDFAIKSVDTSADGGSLIVRGYASVAEVDRDGDMITLDALRRAVDPYLQTNGVVLLNHQQDKPIGRVLSATVDARGLFVEAEIVPGVADWSRDAYAKIRGGVLKAFSIGGYFLRKGSSVVGLDLCEISVVAVGANRASVFTASAA